MSEDVSTTLRPGYVTVAPNRYRPTLRRPDGSTQRIGKRNFYSPEAAREAARAYIDQRARDIAQYNALQEVAQ